MSSAIQKQQPCPSVDEAVAEALKIAGPRTPESRSVLEQNVRLQCLYANEYVAFIDCWDDNSKPPTLSRRVISHSRSLKDIHDALSRLPPQERAPVIIDFCMDPAQEEVGIPSDLRSLDD
jgi:hypothetical protein